MLLGIAPAKIQKNLACAMVLEDKLNDMIKIFFATFFIAELIIAVAVIIKIRQLDKCVNSLNALVSQNKYKIGEGIRDFKWMLAEFVQGFNQLKSLLKRKREEYFLRVLKTSLIYACIFMLKGKYKKSVMAYQFVSEIYSGFSEVDF